MINRSALSVVLLLLLSGCGASDDAPLLGTLERDRIELVAEASEPIVTLRVREGDTVVAGQLLAELDPAVQTARVAAARATRDQARHRREELARGPRIEQIQQARAQYAAADAQRVAAEREFERVTQLVAQRLVANSTLDARRADRDATAATAAAARAALTELERGTRIEQVDQATAVIDALPYKLGERPPAGAPVIIMVTADAPYARVYVPEPLRARAVPGTPATIRVDGNDRDWHGRLRFIASEAAYTPYYALNQRDRSRLSYLAEITLTDTEAGKLPTGVPLQVRLGPATGP
jgi:HlyD family secretion protein